MNVEIERGESRYVSIKVGSNTYLFEKSDYDALFHALLQNPASDVVWVSCVTADLVPDPEDCGGLIDELDEFVDRAVWEHGYRDECNHAVTRPLDCADCETCTQIVCVECGEYFSPCANCGKDSKGYADIGDGQVECQACYLRGIEN